MVFLESGSEVGYWYSVRVGPGAREPGVSRCGFCDGSASLKKVSPEAWVDRNLKY